MSDKHRVLKCSSCGAALAPEKLAKGEALICERCGTPFARSMRKRTVQTRSTAIVESIKGILVIAGKRGLYSLPGATVREHERRENSVVRGLREETGLKAKKVDFLFSHDEPDDGRKIRNLHRVFLIEADGRPGHRSGEAKKISYWKPGSSINTNNTSKLIMERYFAKKTPADSISRGQKTQTKKLEKS